MATRSGPASMLGKTVILEFEKHAERMRAASRDRKESVAFRNVVDDNVERDTVSVNETLGKPQPGDKFQGDTNLRTLRTLLGFIDERGWERSAHQVAFHDAFQRCVSRVLYRQEWATQRPAIMAANGWAKCSSEVMIRIAIFCAALALSTSLEIVIFSFLRVLDCEDRIIEFNQEACRIHSYDGKKSLIRSFPCANPEHSPTRILVVSLRVPLVSQEQGWGTWARDSNPGKGRAGGSTVYRVAQRTSPTSWRSSSSRSSFRGYPQSWGLYQRAMLQVQRPAPRISAVLGFGDGFDAPRASIESISLPQLEEAHPSPEVRKSGTLASWATEVVANAGVLAALPATKGHAACIVALDRGLASGSAGYFCGHLATEESQMNTSKSRAKRGGSTYESVTLLKGEPAAFLPDGRSYGFARGSIDSIVEAGYSVEVKRLPYLNTDDVVQVGVHQQRDCVANELAYTLDAASRGIAPAILACFAGPAKPLDAHNMHSPLSLLEQPSGLPSKQIEALVYVTHVSTFTLDDVMVAYAKESEPALRTKLRGTLKNMCAPMFKQIRSMCALNKGYGMVKINMLPCNVAFCPRLVEDSDSWNLEGHGYRPISQDFLDGTPFLTDFNSLLTMRVREDQYSVEASFVLHSLVLVACARALHGQAVSRVVWDHLLSDKEAFLPAVRAMSSKATNTSAFLAHIARSYETRKFAELSRITAEITSDMDRVLRSGLITPSNDFALPADTQLFSRLVGVLTGSASCDTRIFDIASSNLGEREEMDARAALEAVKRERMQRVAGAA